MRFILLLLFLVSCSSKNPVVEPATRTEVIDSASQTLNLPIERALKALNDSFSSTGIEISSIDQGRITTFPKRIKETVLGAQTFCDVVFKAKIEEVRKETEELIAASKVQISYTEDCLELNLTDVKYKNSKAENLMLLILDKIKVYK